MPDLEIIHRAPSGAMADTRPPLLFVHGAFCGAWVWDENFLPWFAKRGWDCHAVSLRGHGDSQGAGTIDLLGLGDFVDDVAETIAGLGREPVLIGHSMGGLVIQRLMARLPVKGAAMMASAPPNGLLVSSMAMALRDPALFQSMSLMAALGGGRAIDRSQIKRALFSERVAMEDLIRWEPKLGRESRRALMEMSGWNPFPPKPIGSPPALVMGAARDALFDPSQVAATARHLGVTPVIVPEMGHTMMLEPDWIEAARPLAEWLDATFGGFSSHPAAGS